MLAAAVALLGSMLLFVGHSLRTMTGSAIRSVPLDWQGPVGSYAQARQAAARRGAQPGIQQASGAATAPFAGAAHTGPAGTTNAGSGQLLAVPPGLPGPHPHLPLAAGVAAPRRDRARPAARRDAAGTDRRHRHPHPAARGAAAALPGLRRRADHRPGRRLSAAEPAARAGARAAAGQRRDHAAATFAGTLARALPTHRPPPPVPPPCRERRTARSGRCRRRSTPAACGAAPGQAFTRAGQIVHRVERTLPGQVQFVDNLSDQLEHRRRRRALRGDALHHAGGARRAGRARPRATSPRSAPSTATAATSRCCAPAARPAATCC